MQALGDAQNVSRSIGAAIVAFALMPSALSGTLA
jgi:hypothetical protein